MKKFMFLCLYILLFAPVACFAFNSEEVVFNKVGVAVLDAAIVSVEPTVYGSPEVIKKAPDTYLALTIRIKNYGGNAVRYLPVVGQGSLTLIDEVGRTYRSVSVSQVDAQNAPGIINPGEKSEVKVNFERPNPDAKLLILHFPKHSLWDPQAIMDELKDKPDIEVGFSVEGIRSIKQGAPGITPSMGGY